MLPDKILDNFLADYDHVVAENAHQLRKLILQALPNIIEQLDLPAKMIAYCYGQKYTYLICVLIPSKKGLKLGFNQGTQLTDPGGLLQGNGKVSRYVVIESKEDIVTDAITELLNEGLKLYRERIKK